ncbi:MAG: HAMP domain-containing protein [Nitrospirae bacterium]|nr:MAG: HAMP domain-containing protein [Nitrospirota bacterium]
MSFWRFRGVLLWVLSVGVILVGLAIATQDLLDKVVIEEIAAENLHAEFLRASASVSRIIRNAQGDIHNAAALKEAFQDIFELRPGIRQLQVFEVSPDSRRLILSSDPNDAASTLSAHEWGEVSAGRSMAHFDDSTSDRAWIIAAPIMKDGRVVGALRGRFSLWKYDRLIKKERELAKNIALGAVLLTCLAFLVFIRVKVHRPIRRLLLAMRRAEAGDLSSEASVTGPSDIQEVTTQFNRLLGRVREAMTDKERLLGEVRSLNDSLVTKVSEATSELRRTNLMLAEAQIQVERTEKLAAIGELSAVVAHELGNPLNAISGHLQMLLKDDDPRDRDRHLTIIKCESDRMVGIIQHILDSTRVQVRPASVDLNSVIQEVVALLSPGLPSRHITVKTDLTPHLPSVAGDRRAIHGMIFNLATNAIQAMPRGGELEVNTCQVLSERPVGSIVLGGGSALRAGAVRLTVRDTGEGISPEHLGKIFEPFFTTRHAEGGTGLGLAICLRVVSSSGGRLAVQSTVGQGTVFTIDLPTWKCERSTGGPDGG